MLQKIKTNLGPHVVLMMCFVVVSCGGKQVEYDPYFFATDHTTQSIVSEDGMTVYADSPEFDSYVCAHHLKISELANILAVAKVPWWYTKRQKKLIKKMKSELKKITPQ